VTGSRVLDCAGRLMDLARPRVMGILNTTPDSFSDGGAYLSTEAAIRHAWQMLEEGADIIDVGGESTRPGAQAVAETEELRRVVPVIEALARERPVPVSVDTSKAAVMRAAVAAGAGMINDVRALRGPGCLEAALDAAVPVCLMHMQGEPRDMQSQPRYSDVVGEVRAFLAQRIDECVQAGIACDKLLIDPGFGFGKTLEHNLALFRHLRQLGDLGAPLLVGVSRKRMIGALLGGAAVEQRVYGSVAAAVLAAAQGAAILRVHDVRPTVEALRVAVELF
jgi:dihydropteroate synthase